jgi:hypothetical protein
MARGKPIACETLLAGGFRDGQQYLALAGPVVEVNQDDLLPCAQREFAAPDGNAEVGFQQRRAEMRITIPVAPGLVVSVGRVHGSDLFERPFEVRQGSPLILNRSQRRRRTCHKQVYDSFLDAGSLDGLSDLGRNLDNLVETLGGEL